MASEPFPPPAGPPDPPVASPRSTALVPVEVEAVQLERRLNRQVHRAIIAVAVLVLGLGLAAAVVPIGGAVIGMGHIGMESRAKRVTHPTGGVIGRIYVRNGDHVRAGDPLLRFDDAVSGSQSALAELSVHQLLARQARLEAEQMGRAEVRFPAALTRANDAGAVTAMRDEQRLFALRETEQRGLATQMGARITQMQREISGYRAQIEALREQDQLIRPELEGIRDLWKRGLVTITRKNELERAAVQIHGSIAALQADIAQAQARIAETRQQIITLGQTRRSDAGAELAGVKAALNEQQVRSVAATDTQSRSLIRAAYAGIVDKMAFFAVGDVVRPAEPIMEIIPENDTLIVEASVSPADVEQVHTGMRARVRLSSLNSTATPEVSGKVIFVGADQTVDPRTGAAFFSVRVQMDAQALQALGDVTLRQGMPAEIFIETGSRSMLSYLTKPIADQLERAFRDN